ncbi:hypothetical protein BASA81_001052 [Batrachochytrium salamandrivorans]|nr:hypothetical protein BASA81_001052 [Batrachochytrium salamandrivorans]
MSLCSIILKISKLWQTLLVKAWVKPGDDGLGSPYPHHLRPSRFTALFQKTLTTASMFTKLLRRILNQHSPSNQALCSSRDSENTPPPFRLSSTPRNSSSNNNNEDAFRKRQTSFAIFSTVEGAICTKDYSKLATTVRQIMYHPTMGKRFRDFALHQRADEGIRFLDDLALVANGEFINKMEEHQAATKLMEQYFFDSAPRLVNLTAQCRDTLLDEYATGFYVNLSKLFEGAMYEVFSDLKSSDAFRLFCAGDEDAKVLSEDADTLLLDAWITPDRFHHASLAFQGDQESLNRLRFCCSVSEFERLPPQSVQRLAQGNKISATFCQSGARFQLEGIPKLYLDAILKGEYEQGLFDLKTECLQILSLEVGLIRLARQSVANGM